MKIALLFGPSGAGKSHVSRAVTKATGAALLETDRVFWHVIRAVCPLRRTEHEWDRDVYEAVRGYVDVQPIVRPAFARTCEQSGVTASVDRLLVEGDILNRDPDWFPAAEEVLDDLFPTRETHYVALVPSVEQIAANTRVDRDAGLAGKERRYHGEDQIDRSLIEGLRTWYLETLDDFTRRTGHRVALFQEAGTCATALVDLLLSTD